MTKEKDLGYRVFCGRATRQITADGKAADASRWYWEPVDYDGDVLWSGSYATEGLVRHRSRSNGRGGAPAMTDFAPTHKITHAPHAGEAGQTTVYVVMLDDGIAYTREEWDACAKADWTHDAEEGWRWRGEAMPSPGTITVERMEPDRRGTAPR